MLTKLKSKYACAFLKTTSVPNPKLHNYLRTYRKRAGLSQDELAFLLGCRSGTKASRYELCRRVPGLPTMFAYEVIFRIPPRELFAGIFEQVRRITIRRVRALHRRLGAAPPGRLTAHKLAALKEVLEHMPR
jgi:transcriptional regulator with XRE-family HTH domain